MLSLVAGVVVGGALGAGLGYFGQCSSGACPLTSTWWRGALYGAGLGLLFSLASPGRGSAALNQSSLNVKLIGENQFEAEVVKAASPVVLDFFAPWCGPCRTLAPRLDALAGQFTNRVKFLKVNVDEAPGLAQRFEIQGVPTLVFFQGGKAVDRLVGLASADTLKARIQSLTGTSATPMAAN